MTTKINADANGLTETVDTSGILEIQTNGTAAVIIGVDQNANFTSTGAITVPAGTTAQRPTPVNGMMRYNSNVAVFEVYANNTWAAANVTPAPTNTVAPVISGSAVVGQNLTCTTGTWSGSPSAYFYQWRANSTAISNATANVFTLTSTQTGANITCNVIAQNIAGNSSPATSNSLGPVVLGTTVNYLIVAGGGGGGAIGGGGAGGFQTGTTLLQPANTYSITVGAGGAGTTSSYGSNGTSSSIAGLTASVGGGAGAGGASPYAGYAGGSGGGGGGDSGVGGSGGAATSGQGNNGGNGNTNGGGTQFGGGGGGGAGQAGQSAPGTSTGGYGGNGSVSSISGVAVTYAGGGGGGAYVLSGTGTNGVGGSGGGGAGGKNGTNAVSASASTGSGGGGNGYTSAGNLQGTSGAGGSGIVIISYAGAQQFGGGVITTDGSNTIHTFTTSGSLVPLTALSANYLIVGGGGGGGKTLGGGGGGGGVVSGSNVTIDSSSTYVITVGSGGAGGTGTFNVSYVGANGTNSSFSLVSTASVGGGGGGASGVAAGNGGSGGGSGYNSTAGTGTSLQGNNGGTASSSAPNYGAGGGGGAGAVGGNGTSTVGGTGGVGVASSISGTSTYYAGGGGAGTYNGGTPGAGGNGGGGAGATSATATSGTANTGGGGGGVDSQVGTNSPAGNGGSGVVIISYPGSTPMMAGGNVTVVSNTVVHTFTSSGYLTPFVNFNNSLRFRLGGPAKLTRTPTVSSSTLTKLTYSAWIKRGKLGTYQSIYGGYIPTGPTNDCVRFTSSDTIDFNIAGGAVGYIGTTQVFRDPAAWYHIFAVVDTTQAASADRMKLWINGVQVNQAPSPSPSQNYNLTGWNNAGRIQNIGTDTDGSSFPFDGYMAEVYSIDGQALTPNAFGSFNQYGVWAPVRYAGSYGTNGFYLNFGNTANTTALGFDSSPQGNNWTPTNISLTAGATYDSMTDVPTLTSANVANYCVLNPIMPGDYFASGQSALTLTNGNLNYGTAGRNAFASMAVSSGKWYWEFSNTSNTGSASTLSGLVTLADRASVYGVYYNSSNGNKGLGTLNSGATETSYGATWTDNDIIGVALDMDAATPTVTFYKNNSSQGAISVSSFVGKTVFAWMQNGANSGNMSGWFNFGQRPFTYTPPAGYLPLNTYNM